MKEVLCHPLGPLPWSLATPEGTLRKTNKAAKKLHKSVPFAEKLQQPSATIIDGMALVQKCDQKNFRQVASSNLSSAVPDGSQSILNDVAFYVYHAISIKSTEYHQRR